MANIDFAKQTQFREANLQAATWLGSACATEDATTALNCLSRAEGYTLSMAQLQQTAVEATLVRAMAGAVVALASTVQT